MFNPTIWNLLLFLLGSIALALVVVLAWRWIANDPSKVPR